MSEPHNEELVLMGSVEEALVAEAASHALRIRESLEVEMRDVKDGVLRMGSYVEEKILAADDAIMKRDAALAGKGSAYDERVT